MDRLKAPFQYFGGKSQVADIVWGKLGKVKTYLEPFFGSGAVLFARPLLDDFGREVVNDYDGHVCNVWRSIKLSPEEVVKWCDWPCNHIDLHARRTVLVDENMPIRQKLIDDPLFHDPKIAGYWIWAQSNSVGRLMYDHHEIPQKGICSIPEITNKRGCMAKGYDVPTELKRLSERLKNVAVTCGDWSQLFGGNWRTANGTCGIFFDPPYLSDMAKRVYMHDNSTIAHAVRKWCADNGDNPLYRLALCGYAGEHDALESIGWSVVEWKARGGFSALAQRDDTIGKGNPDKERIWFSPHCIKNTLF